MSVSPASTGDVWSVDADASLQSVIERPDIPPPLRQALTGVLSWQARNDLSVRRALKSPRVAPQWVAALLALGATVVGEGEAGTSEVPLEALLQRRVEGAPSGLRVEMGGKRWGEAHVSRTPSDPPIVAAAAVVEMDGRSTGSGPGDIVRQARIALTGAWPEPVRLVEATGWLVGGPLDAPCIRAVAAAVEEEVVPVGDFLGSEEYRRAMAGVTTRRALEACASGGGK